MERAHKPLSTAYIFGTICPQRCVGAGVVMPHCYTHAMQTHLEVIARQVKPGAHAVLLMWDTTDKLKVPLTITIQPLPPRAPELNPVENLWQFMRDNWLSKRFFKTYEGIVAHCRDAWKHPTGKPEKDYLNRHAKMGTCVLVNDGWY